MSYSNYEQTVIVESVALSGVQSVEGSYGITESPVRVAGVGFIDAFPDAPLEGNFRISRKMVSRDPLLSLSSEGTYLYDESEISGAILYDNQTKGFGFTKGRVNRYSVSCSVGDIPNIDTDITVYGEFGSGVMPHLGSPLIEHPPMQFPDQSSVSISVDDFNTDAITDFSYSRSINLRPVYAIHQGDPTQFDPTFPSDFNMKNLQPVQVDTQYPIETDINFTMIVNEYEVREIKNRIQSAPKTNLKIEIRDSKSNDMINSFTGKNVRLISESLTSSVEGEMSVSLTYKGYEPLHNF
tara:strand:- start:329 stop:1216 length:888 start_codon:yes stop_codon:yes gene_type:complete